MANSGYGRILALVLTVFVSMKVSGLCQNCFNGELNDQGTCDCYPGWSGSVCQYCTGRIRLNGTSGSIVSQFGGKYKNQQTCMWFIEAEEAETDINIRFELMDTECGWDYLHVFQGDSVLGDKMASFNGELVSPELRMEPTMTSDGDNSTNNTATATPELCKLLPEYEPHPPLDFTLKGSAVLYFASDANAIGKGINLTYWTDCDHNCSGNGVCSSRNGTCECDRGWSGPLCDEKVCPNNCSAPQGFCNMATGVCVCASAFAGVDCNINANDIHWKTVDTVVSPLVHLLNESHSSVIDLELESGRLQRAGHSAVVWGNYMWVFGGYTFPLGKNSSELDLEPLLWRFHLESHTWEAFITPATPEVPQNNSSSSVAANMSTSVDDNVTATVEDVTVAAWPSARYGHSAVVYQGAMYIFGGELVTSGVVSNELWAFNLTSFEWQVLLPSNRTTSSYLPLAVRHHTAHVVDDHMLIIWGFAGNRGNVLTRLVQQYDFLSGAWSAAPQSGVPVQGAFAHTSVRSEENGLVYVFGGRRSDNRGRGTALHYLYNTTSGEWSKLPRVPQTAYYHHSAVLVGSSVVVFGGRVRGKECFTDTVLIYDTVCRVWHTPSVPIPGLPFPQGMRYAHTAVQGVDPQIDSVLVFGGYNSLLFGDLLELQLPNCSAALSKEACLSNTTLGLCAWDTADNLCSRADLDNEHSCMEDSCSAYTTCSLCAENGCQWLNNSTDLRCASIDPMANATGITDAAMCSREVVEGCSRYVECQDCVVDNCTFNSSGQNAKCNNSTMGIKDPSSCGSPQPCAWHSTCSSCGGDDKCVWCPSEQRCAQSGYYPELFPFGQCLGWVDAKCPEVNCSAYKDCDGCVADERCGWCNDESNTGLGTCSEGGFNSDLKGECSNELWYFDGCPLCQCSGHSVCTNGSICANCSSNTTGDRCQFCEETQFGDPRNGGTCEPCFCNGYAIDCENRTGQCSCNTRGVTGLQCDSCIGTFHGNALEEDCTAQVLYGFQYTFNLTEENAYFFVVPTRDEVVTFTVEQTSRTGSATVTLSYGQRSAGLLNRSGEGRQGLGQWTIGPSYARISRNIEQGGFGNGNNALFVAFTDIESPLLVTMSFQASATNPILVAFLVFTSTFVICLTVMLIFMSVSWFGFRWYDRRRRARRHRREMRRRVARPYATVQALIHDKPGIVEPQQVGYVGVEPLVDNKAAVVSILVQLPGKPENGRPRQGQTGVCFGSALVRIKTKPSSSAGNKKKKRIFKRKRNGHPSSTSSNGESRSAQHGQEASTDV